MSELKNETMIETTRSKLESDILNFRFHRGREMVLQKLKFLFLKPLDEICQLWCTSISNHISWFDERFGWPRAISLSTRFKQYNFFITILTLDEDFSLATETCRAVEVEFELESAFEEWFHVQRAAPDGAWSEGLSKLESFHRAGSSLDDRGPNCPKRRQRVYRPDESYGLNGGKEKCKMVITCSPQQFLIMDREIIFESSSPGSHDFRPGITSSDASWSRPKYRTGTCCYKNI